MDRLILQRLIDECRAAPATLSDQIARLLAVVSPRAVLEWARDDPHYAPWYYDVQQDGACAKPAEAAALVLEAIVRDALEEA